MSMSDKKMTTKKTISGGFNLDAFVGGADAPIPSVLEPAKRASKPRKVAKSTKPLVEAKKPARGAKIAPERPKETLTERVQIRLTSFEMKKLDEHCGLVPVSTFLRNFMKENGLI